MKNLLLVFAAFGLFAVIPSIAMAQEDPPVAQVEGRDGGSASYKKRIDVYRLELKTELDDVKEDKLVKVCENILTKISTTRNNLTSFNEKHTNIYDNWRQRLGTLNARLLASGVDTTQLDAYLEELDGLLSTNSSDVQALLASLESFSTDDCATSPDTFYEQLQEARAGRKLIIENHKQTISLIKEKIKAELMKIRLQLTAQEGSN